MDTARAHRKFREAKFFLARLQDMASNESIAGNLEAFDYYLSAFLGAADSVIGVAKLEAKLKRG
jgi:hypothetical protein